VTFGQVCKRLLRERVISYAELMDMTPRTVWALFDAHTAADAARRVDHAEDTFVATAAAMGGDKAFRAFTEHAAALTKVSKAQW